MVDADHAQGRALSPRRQGDGHSRLIKSGGDRIYRDRVMWVCTVKRQGLGEGVHPEKSKNLRISAHVTDDRQASVW